MAETGIDADMLIVETRRKVRTLLPSKLTAANPPGLQQKEPLQQAAALAERIAGVLSAQSTEGIALPFLEVCDKEQDFLVTLREMLKPHVHLSQAYFGVYLPNGRSRDSGRKPLYFAHAGLRLDLKKILEPGLSLGDREYVDMRPV